MKKIFQLIAIVLFTGWFLACSDEPVEPTCQELIEELAINEYQIIGSHNSYRQAITPEIWGFIQVAGDMLPEDFDPNAWDYAHIPVREQLDNYGIRSIEIDVYRDPDGGLFKNRMGNGFVGLDVDSGEPELSNEGLKVLHFPDFDYNSHYMTFKGALEDMKDWSSSNPNHLPLTILVEAKEDSPAIMLPGMGLTESLPFTNNSVEEIESEILEVFGSQSSQLLLPSDVKDNHSSLRSAVLAGNWPTIAESRGKIAIVLMAREGVIQDYVSGHPSLDGRSMFVFTDADSDEAAFININNPTDDFNEIQSLATQGFIVRTQADSDTYEAREGDYTRFNNAIAAGAHIICTDYYRPDPRAESDAAWTDYTVALSNNRLAEINSVTNSQTDISCPITE